MPTSIDLSAIKALPVDEKLRIVEDIWESITEELDNSELDDDMKAELDRRIADYDADPSNVVPWDVVKAASFRRART
jgi:putative addiction module component (TIGR02574 family)